MLVPVIELGIGLLAVLSAGLSYTNTGSSALPAVLRHPGDRLWLAGWTATGLALMMGMIGFVLHVDLGLARVLVGGVGLALLFARRWPDQGELTEGGAVQPAEMAHGRWAKPIVSLGATLVLATEGLSLLKALTPSMGTALWLSAGAVAGAYGWRRLASSALPPLPPGAVDRALLSGVLLLVATLAAVALMVPPNTWDAMAYHVPRVMHWVQQASVAHYHTTIPRQLYQPPGASFIVLHSYLLARSDRLVNMVQWGSMLGSLFGVAALAALLGGGGRARVLAVVVAASIPIGVLEATTAQNDYVEAFWLVCLALFVVARQSSLWVGLALGLALLTKGTGYPFAAPLIAWWSADTMVRKRWRAGGALAVAVVLAVGLNAGHYGRNLAWFGAPLGPGRDGPFVYGNERHSVLSILSVAARNLAVHAATPWPRVNAQVTHAVETMHSWVGLDVNDPLTTWYQTRFVVGPLRATEDLASNGIHLALIVVAFAAVLRRRRADRVAIYAMVLVVAFLMFSALFRWQPWHSRLELPLFVLAAPVVGIVLEHRRLMGPLIGGGLIAVGVLVFVVNESRPLIGPRNVFQAERIAQFFADRRDLEEAYRASAARIKELRCRRVAVWSARDAAEYPLWVLTGSPRSGVQIEHFDVEHPAATACALFIAPLYDAPARLPVAGVPYRRDVWMSPVALYVREPS